MLPVKINIKPTTLDQLKGSLNNGIDKIKTKTGAMLIKG